MKKLKEWLLSVNFFLLIFVLVGARVTLFGAGIGDALCIGFICALHCFSKWNETQIANKIEKDKEAIIVKELTDIKSHISGLMMKGAMKPAFTQPKEREEITRFF